MLKLKKQDTFNKILYKMLDSSQFSQIYCIQDVVAKVEDEEENQLFIYELKI